VKNKDNLNQDAPVAVAKGMRSQKVNEELDELRAISL
jgi:hypothetical protein